MHLLACGTANKNLPTACLCVCTFFYIELDLSWSVTQQQALNKQ